MRIRKHDTVDIARRLTDPPDFIAETEPLKCANRIASQAYSARKNNGISRTLEDYDTQVRGR
jgi:hypothetical protein